MQLGESITAVPILHGKMVFAQEVRRLCSAEKFDCVAVDIPEIFQNDLGPAVDRLPAICAVVARSPDDRAYYVPVDPCDPAIEAIRQGNQNRIPYACIGSSHQLEPVPLTGIPDEFAATRIGFELFSSLCLSAVGNPGAGSAQDLAGQYIAFRLHELRTRFSKILACVHVRHFVRAVHHFNQEKTHNLTFPAPPEYEINSYAINPDHLYFALGELPFVAGKFEKERYDAFAEPEDLVAAIKDLFRETRDEYYDEPERAFELSPSRIQVALTYLRNLTVMSGRMIPSLLDIVESAKGVGGNAYALRILKSARYYPYLPFEDALPVVAVSINRISVPGERMYHAVNLFRDIALVWRSIGIKPEPSMEMKKKFRFTWNPQGMCSHVPEDRRIESFNDHVRAKTLRVLTEDFAHTEKFSTSVKDGIDMRETLRNWHTGAIFVRELPPSRGKIDTVVIVFDESHDERYPHCATWYAEHDEESTLTFYATDPFENLIGPGVARCSYGGLSLVFPPRPIPDIFELTKDMGFESLAARLAYGALLFSGEKIVAYVAARKPRAALKGMARRLKKHLVWIPLSNFSNETLGHLRRFHILNGKTVRTWANRFIGD